MKANPFFKGKTSSIKRLNEIKIKQQDLNISFNYLTDHVETPQEQTLDEGFFGPVISTDPFADSELTEEPNVEPEVAAEETQGL